MGSTVRFGRTGGRGTPRRRGARLFLVYAAASLVPVSILGLALTRGYHDGGRTQALDQGRAQAAVIEQMAVAPALGGADLSKGLARRERERLQSATDLAIFHGSVSRLRLLSFTGTVAFSDDGGVLGSVARNDPGFRAAARGGVVARIVDVEPGLTGRSIRVLQPVIPEASGRAIGVLEVFLPYDAIADKVAADTRRAIVRLALGLGSLYAVLALISYATTRALRRFAADNERQALHDPLTGLANRELFRRVAEQALSRALLRPEANGGGALVLVDLDHFKEVNDNLGHHAGDQLLRVVAQRLSDSLRTDDTVARLGGDEFGIILPSSQRDETVELLGRVRRELSAPVTIDHATLSVEASFGVCFFPDDAVSVEGLLQHADAAMYRGKNGPDGVVVYAEGAADAGAAAGVDALVMQGELRHALACDEFVLHYQPKLDMLTGRTTGVEALVRWQHPERGLLPPASFLPVAERTELIVPLTEWVVRRAVDDLVDWTDAGFDWHVSVNVSARNLSSLAFADTVIGVLESRGVPPHRLCLEVTETAMAFDNQVAASVVAALSAYGIPMSLDDFGVGYTAISQLRDLAMSEIKIDRLFITGLDDNEQDRAIVGSVIDLAHSLGSTVTAEGVETEAVAAWLRGAGCDHAQGFLWSRPRPWTELACAGTDDQQDQQDHREATV
jgi:diguanylate cyclase (GGDEF)-like protein